MSDVQMMLESLTARDAAIAASRAALAGQHRRGCALLQLAAALEALQPPTAPRIAYVAADDTPVSDHDLAQLRKHFHAPKLAANAVKFLRASHRGRRDTQAAAGDTAVIPLPAHESHAPTDCTFHVHGIPCGELIRWSEANGWYHVSDRHLGAAAHPATPGAITRA